MQAFNGKSIGTDTHPFNGIIQALNRQATWIKTHAFNRTMQALNVESTGIDTHAFNVCGTMVEKIASVECAIHEKT